MQYQFEQPDYTAGAYSHSEHHMLPVQAIGASQYQHSFMKNANTFVPQHDTKQFFWDLQHRSGAQFLPVDRPSNKRSSSKQHPHDKFRPSRDLSTDSPAFEPHIRHNNSRSKSRKNFESSVEVRPSLISDDFKRQMAYLCLVLRQWIMCAANKAKGKLYGKQPDHELQAYQLQPSGADIDEIMMKKVRKHLTKSPVYKQVLYSFYHFTSPSGTNFYRSSDFLGPSELVALIRSFFDSELPSIEKITPFKNNSGRKSASQEEPPRSTLPRTDSNYFQERLKLREKAILACSYELVYCIHFDMAIETECTDVSSGQMDTQNHRLPQFESESFDFSEMIDPDHSDISSFFVQQVAPGMNELAKAQVSKAKQTQAGAGSAKQQSPPAYTTRASVAQRELSRQKKRRSRSRSNSPSSSSSSESSVSSGRIDTKVKKKKKSKKNKKRKHHKKDKNKRSKHGSKRRDKKRHRSSSSSSSSSRTSDSSQIQNYSDDEESEQQEEESYKPESQPLETKTIYTKDEDSQMEETSKRTVSRRKFGKKPTGPVQPPKKSVPAEKPSEEIEPSEQAPVPFVKQQERSDEDDDTVSEQEDEIVQSHEPSIRDFQIFDVQGKSADLDRVKQMFAQFVPDCRAKKFTFGTVKALSDSLRDQLLRAVYWIEIDCEPFLQHAEVSSVDKTRSTKSVVIKATKSVLEKCAFLYGITNQVQGFWLVCIFMEQERIGQLLEGQSSNTLTALQREFLHFNATICALKSNYSSLELYTCRQSEFPRIATILQKGKALEQDPDLLQAGKMSYVYNELMNDPATRVIVTGTGSFKALADRWDSSNKVMMGCSAELWYRALQIKVSPWYNNESSLTFSIEGGNLVVTEPRLNNALTSSERTQKETSDYMLQIIKSQTLQVDEMFQLLTHKDANIRSGAMIGVQLAKSQMNAQDLENRKFVDQTLLSKRSDSSNIFPGTQMLSKSTSFQDSSVEQRHVVQKQMALIKQSNLRGAPVVTDQRLVNKSVKELVDKAFNSPAGAEFVRDICNQLNLSAVMKQSLSLNLEQQETTDSNKKFHFALFKAKFAQEMISNVVEQEIAARISQTVQTRELCLKFNEKQPDSSDVVMIDLTQSKEEEKEDQRIIPVKSLLATNAGLPIVAESICNTFNNPSGNPFLGSGCKIKTSGPQQISLNDVRKAQEQVSKEHEFYIYLDKPLNRVSTFTIRHNLDPQMKDLMTQTMNYHDVVLVLEMESPIVNSVMSSAQEINEPLAKSPSKHFELPSKLHQARTLAKGNAENKGNTLTTYQSTLFKPDRKLFECINRLQQKSLPFAVSKVFKELREYFPNKFGIDCFSQLVQATPIEQVQDFDFESFSVRSDDFHGFVDRSVNSLIERLNQINFDFDKRTLKEDYSLATSAAFSNALSRFVGSQYDAIMEFFQTLGNKTEYPSLDDGDKLAFSKLKVRWNFYVVNLVAQTRSCFKFFVPDQDQNASNFSAYCQVITKVLTMLRHITCTQLLKDIQSTVSLCIQEKNMQSYRGTTQQLCESYFTKYGAYPEQWNKERADSLFSNCSVLTNEQKTLNQHKMVIVNLCLDLVNLFNSQMLRDEVDYNSKINTFVVKYRFGFTRTCKEIDMQPTNSDDLSEQQQHSLVIVFDSVRGNPLYGPLRFANFTDNSSGGSSVIKSPANSASLSIQSGPTSAQCKAIFVEQATKYNSKLRTSQNHMQQLLDQSKPIVTMEGPVENPEKRKRRKQKKEEDAKMEQENVKKPPKTMSAKVPEPEPLAASNLLLPASATTVPEVNDKNPVDQKPASQSEAKPADGPAKNTRSRSASQPKNQDHEETKTAAQSKPIGETGASSKLEPLPVVPSKRSHKEREISESDVSGPDDRNSVCIQNSCYITKRKSVPQFGEQLVPEIVGDTRISSWTNNMWKTSKANKRSNEIQFEETRFEKIDWENVGSAEEVDQLAIDACFFQDVIPNPVPVMHLDFIAGPVDARQRRIQTFRNNVVKTLEKVKAKDPGIQFVVDKGANHDKRHFTTAIQIAVTTNGVYGCVICPDFLMLYGKPQTGTLDSYPNTFFNESFVQAAKQLFDDMAIQFEQGSVGSEWRPNVVITEAKTTLTDADIFPARSQVSKWKRKLADLEFWMEALYDHPEIGLEKRQNIFNWKNFFGLCERIEKFTDEFWKARGVNLSKSAEQRIFGSCLMAYFSYSETSRQRYDGKFGTKPIKEVLAQLRPGLVVQGLIEGVGVRNLMLFSSFCNSMNKWNASTYIDMCFHRFDCMHQCMPMIGQIMFLQVTIDGPNQSHAGLCHKRLGSWYY